MWIKINKSDGKIGIINTDNLQSMILRWNEPLQFHIEFVFTSGEIWLSSGVDTLESAQTNLDEIFGKLL